MRDRKIGPKWFVTTIASILILLSSPVPVSANGPVPGPTILIRFDGKPSDVVYVDLLVPIDATSDDFQQYNDEHGKKYSMAADSQIVAYNENGYYSYTFHYVGSSSEMAPGGPNFGHYYDVLFETGLDDLEDKIDYFKVALLDEKGNILHVTQDIRIASSLTGFFDGFVQIDGATLAVTDDGQYTSLWMILLLPFRILPRVAFSVLVEVFIAYLLKITPLRPVVILNIATQAMLTVYMGTASLSYWMSLIVGEVIVYLVEGTAMLFLYKSISKKRIIVYVLVANTVTLSLGILLNQLGVFRY